MSTTPALIVFDCSDPPDGWTCSGSGRVAGEDVVRGRGAHHPKPTVMNVHVAAVHGCSERDVGFWVYALQGAPADVQAVEAVGGQGTVRVEFRDGGFCKERGEMRGGHGWLSSPVCASVRRQATAVPPPGPAPAKRGTSPQHHVTLATQSVEVSCGPVQLPE